MGPGRLPERSPGRTAATSLERALGRRRRPVRPSPEVGTRPAFQTGTRSGVGAGWQENRGPALQGASGSPLARTHREAFPPGSPEGEAHLIPGLLLPPVPPRNPWPALASLGFSPPPGFDQDATSGRPSQAPIWDGRSFLLTTQPRRPSLSGLWLGPVCFGCPCGSQAGPGLCNSFRIC